MISQQMQDALNEQIRNEMHSAYVYLSMAAYFETVPFTGFAQWMRIQAREEMAHGMKIFEHLLDRGGTVRLHAIPEPPARFDSALAVFEQALRHEQEVTRSIHELYALSLAEKDFASRVFLDWFVAEQVEEEKSAQLIVEQLRMVGNDLPGLLILDQRYGERSPEAQG
jgi:ferritin